MCFGFKSQRRLARCGGQRWIRAWMSWTAWVPHPTRGAQVSVVSPKTSLQGDHQLSRSGLVSMLTQPDALPGAQRQTAVADRQRQRRSQEASFDMGGLMSSNIRIVIIINIITCWLFGAIVIRRADRRMDGRRQKIRWQSAGIPVEEISRACQWGEGWSDGVFNDRKGKRRFKKWNENKTKPTNRRKWKKKEIRGRWGGEGVERQRKTERKNTLSYGDSTKSC